MKFSDEVNEDEVQQERRMERFSLNKWTEAKVFQQNIWDRKIFF